MTLKLQNKSLNDLFCSRFNILKKINHYLYKKYINFKYSYSLICINNLISNEKCQIVARFKEYLIYDDNTEFFNEYFNKKNLFSKLKYIFNFYNTFSRIYPNYIIIPENKFLYKNLRKKQKVIDEFNAKKLMKKNDKKLEQEQKLLLLKDDKDEKKFFNKSIVDSINRLNISSNLNSTKKNSNNSYSKTLNYIVSSIKSEIKKSNYLKVQTKPFNLFFKLKNDFENISKKNVNDNIDKTLNTESSSIRLNSFYDENSKSKASLSEIINLINSKNKNIKNKNKKNYLKNVSYEKSTKEKIDKFKNIKKNKSKFLIIDVDYTKKNIKTNKSKIYYYNNVKSQISKSTTPTIQKVEINKNFLNKNYQKRILSNNKFSNCNTNNNNDNKDKNIILYKQTVSFLEDENSEINKIQKRHQLKVFHKLYSNKIILNDNYSNFLRVNTVSNFGNLISNKNKINEPKNYIKNYSNKKYKSRSKKKNSKAYKNLIISSTISINSTINYGNTISKTNLNNNNNNLKKEIDYHNSNEKKENYNKKKSRYKTMKSLQTLISLGEKNNKTNNKEKDIKNDFKLDMNSIQPTTVSIYNKKFKHKKLTHTQKLLTQIKRTVKNKNENKSQKIILKNNTLTLFSKKNNNAEDSNKFFNLNFPSDKVNSNECQHFSDNCLSNIYFSKIKLKKEKAPVLTKNNNIFNKFSSKELYDLNSKNNKIYYIKNSQNKNLTKINQTYVNDSKKNITINDKSKFKKDIYKIDSNSFILKSFHKENVINNYNNNIHDNKSKISKIYRINFKNFDFNKIQKNNHKHLFNKISKHISYDKKENIYQFKKLRNKTKTKTINIISKNKDKIKKKKDIRKSFKNHKKNKITILNNLSNINLHLYLKTPSKTVIKPLDININNKNENNTNFKNNGIIFKDKYYIKNNLFDL